MPKLYELRAFRGDRPVRTTGRLLVTLDLDDPASVNDLLTRHLIAVAERDGTNRRKAHLYHVDLHQIRGEHVDREPFFQFSAPVEA